MKFPDGGHDPWAWWQPLRFRMEARKHMNPITPDTANRRRLILSLFYCMSAAIAFHIVAYNGGAFSWKRNETDVALEHMNDGQIIKLSNFRITKVMDFRSTDFEDKIKKTNKPSAILE